MGGKKSTLSIGLSDDSGIGLSKYIQAQSSRYSDCSQYYKFRKGLHIDDETKIRRCFRLLKDQIDPDPISDYLITYDYLEEDDAEEIRKTVPRRKAVTLLLIKVLRLPETAYKVFLHSLEKTGYAHVASALEDNTLGPVVLDNLDYTVSKCLHLLEAHELLLLDALDAMKILDFYMQFWTFSVDEYEVIFMKSNRKEQVLSLMTHIREKVPESFSVLLFALREIGDNNTYKRITESNLEDNVCVNENVSGDSAIKGLKVKISCKDTLQRDMKNYYSTEEGRAVIKERLKGTGLKVEDITDGSVVFVITPTRRLTVGDLKTFAVNGGIKDLMESFVGCVHGLAKESGDIIVYYSVGVECADVVDFRSELKDAILAKRNLLLEELDALTLMSTFEEKKFFSKKQIQQIFVASPPTRQARTARFLDCILEETNCETGLKLLMDALRKSGKEHIIEILQPRELANGASVNRNTNTEDTFLLSGRFTIRPEETDFRDKRTTSASSIANTEDGKITSPEHLRRHLQEERKPDNSTEPGATNSTEETCVSEQPSTGLGCSKNKNIISSEHLDRDNQEETKAEYRRGTFFEPDATNGTEEFPIPEQPRTVPVDTCTSEIKRSSTGDSGFSQSISGTDKEDIGV